MPTKKQKDTQIVVHSFNGTQLSNKKTTNFCCVDAQNNMNEP